MAYDVTITLDYLVNELNSKFERHEYLMEFGGQDPFWADGSNINLVRNHILHTKEKIKEYCEENSCELPKDYFRDTPDEVPDDYMANADEIRKIADEAVINIKPFYEKLKEEGKYLSEKQKDEICLYNILGYYEGLLIAIENDDLITMRRFRNYRDENGKAGQTYIESFESALEKINKMEKVDVQLTLF